LAGARIWLSLLPALTIYNGLARNTTFDEDPWSTVFDIFIIIITLIFAIYGINVVNRKSPEGLNRFAALQCVVILLTVGTSAQRVLTNIHYFFIPSYPYMTRAIYVVARDTSIILLLVGVSIPMLSTFKSLSCVWEVGGLGTEKNSWRMIVDNMPIWDL